MDRLNYKRKKSNLPVVKPCEVFDLIGGTSTGGLIVVMLGRLEMDLLDDETERVCKTFVCTADRDTKDIIRLRS